MVRMVRIESRPRPPPIPPTRAPPLRSGACAHQRSIARAVPLRRRRASASAEPRVRTPPRRECR